MNRYFRCLGTLILIVLVFVLFNMVSSRIVDSILDLTSNKTFTLTDGTKKILAEIVSPINIYYYSSIDSLETSDEMNRYAQVVKETLDAYERFSLGKVILHSVDTKSSISGSAQAKKLGLRSLQVTADGRNTYFGLAGVSPRGEVKIIPNFQELNIASLEYTLSLLVQQLAKPDRPKLGLIAGLPIAGGFDAETAKELKPWLLLEELSKRYEFEKISPDSDHIPPSIKVLMLVHPKNLSMPTLFAIDQFVMRGGRLLAFVDPFSEQDTGEKYFGVRSMDRSSSIDILFKAWGIELIPKKVVGDSLYAMEASRDPRIQSVRLPTALGLPRQALSNSDVSIGGLSVINMATAGALRPLGGTKTRITPLIQSSSSSILFGTERFSKLVAPEEMIKEISSELGEQHVMAVRIEGALTSAFPDGFEGLPSFSAEGAGIKAVVVADTDLLTDRMWAQARDVKDDQKIVTWADNERFVSNVLDDLFDVDELIESRNRSAIRRIFERVEDIHRQISILRVREASLIRDLAAIENASVQAKALTNQADMNQADVRQKLLEVQGATLNTVRALGIKLKILNIILIPVSSLVIIFICKWVVARFIKGRRRNVRYKTKRN